MLLCENLTKRSRFGAYIERRTAVTIYHRNHLSSINPFGNWLSPFTSLSLSLFKFTPINVYLRKSVWRTRCQFILSIHRFICAGGVTNIPSYRTPQCKGSSQGRFEPTIAIELRVIELLGNSAPGNFVRDQRHEREREHDKKIRRE